MAESTWTKPFSSITGQASSYFNGHTDTSNKGSYSNLPDSSYTSSSTPLQQPGHYSKPPSMSLTRHRKTFTKFKRYLRFVSIFSILVSIFLSTFITASMIYLVYTWVRTRNTVAHDGSRPSPWARGSIVWPTYMILAASVVTFVTSLVMLITVCCRGRKKTMYNFFYYLTHVAVWVVVAVLFRVYKNEKDLWGWSCHPKAAKIQFLYVDVVDFDMLCTIQSADWYVAIAEASVKIVCGALGWYLTTRGNRAKRAIVNELGDAGLEDLL